MRDLYKEVTDRIVAAIESGTPPWVRPWSQTTDPRPANAATQRPYRGINSLLLGFEAQLKGYPHNRWLTFRQAAKLGARVQKNAQGTSVVFYKLREVPEAQPEVSETPKKRVIPLLRAFTVFNVAQIDGLPAGLTAPPIPHSWDAQAEAEQLINTSGAEVRHGGNHAYYDRALDTIHLPSGGAFADRGGYYATALHELAHWTGHPARCNRSLAGRFGDSAYAMEELIAELSSAYLCAHCRIDGRLQHAAYVRGWLPVLKNDKRAIFTASSKAQAAADYLLTRNYPEQLEGVAA